MPPPRPPLPLNPYRLFHLSARLRLRDRPTSTTSPSNQPTPADDYYDLLLSTPSPATPAPTAPEKNPASLPPNAPQSSSAATTNPPTKILFSKSDDISGPSPAARGLQRAERGLERPPEPDNCCMSGCVNCVWDAYREEVEGWAAARKGHAHSLAREVEGVDDEGDVDGVGGTGLEGGSVGCGEEGGDADALFEGVPVGIREFMRQEKRIRERRGGDAALRSYEGRSIESWRVGSRREGERA